ncbi:MAG: hypothetical protein MMC33_002083 [Icmadophila ericetorum]|nr:hypothetical protein [Icmadophila ericetorum]
MSFARKLMSMINTQSLRENANAKLRPIISIGKKVTERQVHIRAQDIIGKRISDLLALLDDATSKVMEEERWSDPGPRKVSKKEEEILAKRKRDADEGTSDDEMAEAETKSQEIEGISSRFLETDRAFHSVPNAPMMLVTLK